MRIDLKECLRESNGLEIRGRHELDIGGIACDSRAVRPGDVFFALAGARDDGANHLDEAVSRGAVAVVSREYLRAPSGVAAVRVDDPRRALACLSSVFFGSPSKEMRVAGITGTNGKTTTAYLLYSIFRSSGVRCGLIGSVEYRLGERVIPARLTTPQSPEIQSMLCEMARSGCGCAVMEVSSHGLHQGRTDFVDFDMAVLTNLTSDHLDYHGSAEAYLQVKLGLFRSLPAGPDACSIVNGDDPAAAEFLESSKCRTLTYGLGDGNDVRARSMAMSRDGTEFTAETPWGSFPANVRLLGLHNVYNALAALTAGLCSGVQAEAAVSGLRAVSRVPGRLEPVECGQPFNVIVDYAHTEDGLRKVTQAVRSVFGGRVIVLFGCGGDRDKSKRTRMAAAAEELADAVVATSDNPRKEDPLEILRDITKGFSGNGYDLIPDRREAISAALRMAGEGDTVLLAGKGHEQYQEFADVVVPFSDVEVSRSLLREMGFK